MQNTKFVRAVSSHDWNLTSLFQTDDPGVWGQFSSHHASDTRQRAAEIINDNPIRSVPFSLSSIGSGLRQNKRDIFLRMSTSFHQLRSSQHSHTVIAETHIQQNKSNNYGFLFVLNFFKSLLHPLQCSDIQVVSVHLQPSSLSLHGRKAQVQEAL